MHTSPALWEHFGSTLGARWEHIGSTLGALWQHFGYGPCPCCRSHGYRLHVVVSYMSSRSLYFATRSHCCSSACIRHFCSDSGPKIKLTKILEELRHPVCMRCIVHKGSGRQDFPRPLFAKCLHAMSTKNGGASAGFRCIGPEYRNAHSVSIVDITVFAPCGARCLPRCSKPVVHSPWVQPTLQDVFGANEGHEFEAYRGCCRRIPYRISAIRVAIGHMMFQLIHFVVVGNVHHDIFLLSLLLHTLFRVC